MNESQLTFMSIIQWKLNFCVLHLKKPEKFIIENRISSLLYFLMWCNTNNLVTFLTLRGPIKWRPTITFVIGLPISSQKRRWTLGEYKLEYCVRYKTLQESCWKGYQDMGLSPRTKWMLFAAIGHYLSLSNKSWIKFNSFSWFSLVKSEEMHL